MQIWETTDSIPRPCREGLDLYEEKGGNENVKFLWENAKRNRAEIEGRRVWVWWRGTGLVYIGGKALVGRRWWLRRVGFGPWGPFIIIDFFLLLSFFGFTFFFTKKKLQKNLIIDFSFPTWLTLRQWLIIQVLFYVLTQWWFFPQNY